MDQIRLLRSSLTSQQKSALLEQQKLEQQLQKSELSSQLLTMSSVSGLNANTSEINFMKCTCNSQQAQIRELEKELREQKRINDDLRNSQLQSVNSTLQP